jgi:glucokinase
VSRRLGIGIDAGGTKIAAGLVDLDTGEILRRETIATDAERGGQAVLDDTVMLAERLANGITPAIASIGIGMPEIVDPTGAIRTGAVIDWVGLPCGERLGLIAPTTIEADVRAAALAEARFGAGVGRASFIYVTIGTGISSTIVLDGRPFTGARGGALVMASAPLDVTCASCGKRTSLVLEEFAGGPAIARRYRNATGVEVTGAIDVVEAASKGDVDATEILVSSGHEIGVSIAFLINVIDPDAVVIGGGLGSANGVFRDALIASTRAHIWNDAARELPIDRATFGPESGMIGAALAADKS